MKFLLNSNYRTHIHSLLMTCGGPSLWRLLHSMCNVAASLIILLQVSWSGRCVTSFDWCRLGAPWSRILDEYNMDLRIITLGTLVIILGSLVRRCTYWSNVQDPEREVKHKLVNLILIYFNTNNAFYKIEHVTYKCELTYKKEVNIPSRGGLEVERSLHKRRDSASVGSNPI